MFTQVKRILAVGTAALLTTMTGPTALAADYPNKDVTFIVPFGAGGGSDLMMRTIASIAQELNLVPSSILVENRPGSSSVVGYTALARRKGDGHFLSPVGVGFYTAPLLKISRLNPLKDFTPVGIVAMSPYVVAVRSDSPLQSIDDLVQAKRLTTGSVGVLSDAALLSHLINDATRSNIEVIPFDGEGEIITGVLGKHLDFVIGNYEEILPHVQSGSMRAIAVSTAARLSDLPDVPTFKERGHDIEYVLVRGLVMPADAPQDAVKAWEDILAKVTASPQWKERYLDRFKLMGHYRNAQDAAGVIQDTYQRYANLVEKLNIVR